MTRSERFYRWLLRLLPPDYRREAAPEILEVFREARADCERSGSRFRRIRFWASSLADLLATAVRARNPWGRGLGHDFRVAFRQMKTHGVWSFLVILILGLGIGSTTALFSVFRSLRCQDRSC
jgi:hypothetical protein